MAAGEAEAGLWDCRQDQGERVDFGKAAAGLPPTGAGVNRTPKKDVDFTVARAKWRGWGALRARKWVG
jgi:hypothetical protein